MAKVPNGVETLRKISIAWVGCTNVIDDRQTDDRRRHIANMNMSSCSLKIGQKRAWPMSHDLHFKFRNPTNTYETDEDINLKFCIRLKVRNTKSNNDKKLIRRWVSERELSLRRHHACTTKYNRLVHKLRHRSKRLCIGTHVLSKFSEITQYNGHYVVQGHSRSPILVPIESSYTTSY